jgi:hypothetical protein
MRVLFFLFLFLTQGAGEKYGSAGPIIEKTNIPVVKSCSVVNGSCRLEQAGKTNDGGLLLARIFSNS